MLYKSRNFICILLCILAGFLLTGCHTHNFSRATCTEPMFCSECGQTQGSPLGHTVVIDSPAKNATCTKDGVTESSHCSVCGAVLSNAIIIPATGHDIATSPGEEATCTEDGYTESKYCKICLEHFSESETIPALGHDLDEKGYCKRCGIADKTSDTYKLGRIQTKAEKIALNNVEDYLRSVYTENLVFLSEKVEKRDEWLRYLVTIEYRAKNPVTGLMMESSFDRDVRVSSKCDGTCFTHDNDYGKRPSDWSLDWIDTESAPSVTIENLLSSYNSYNGLYIQLASNLVLAHNNIDRKSFTCYKSTGTQKNEYDTDKRIELFYSLCDNSDALLSLTADRQKIVLVCGYVHIYNNENKPYMDVTDIKIYD